MADAFAASRKPAMASKPSVNESAGIRLRHDHHSREHRKAGERASKNDKNPHRSFPTI
ncbi:hypothetical protein [Sphingopyxis bauzanensis]|uniref:hypothetical protein n=1 Tax=Sphingopyxis bauzanensis TaxID=651663 RepID=UPI001E62FE1F|nr:hypothetical protein [Sphingopyxis bauzanensis]